MVSPVNGQQLREARIKINKQVPNCPKRALTHTVLLSWVVSAVECVRLPGMLCPFTIAISLLLGTSPSIACSLPICQSQENMGFTTVSALLNMLKILQPHWVVHLVHIGDSDKARSKAVPQPGVLVSGTPHHDSSQRGISQLSKGLLTIEQMVKTLYIQFVTLRLFFSPLCLLVPSGRRGPNSQRCQLVPEVMPWEWRRQHSSSPS